MFERKSIILCLLIGSVMICFKYRIVLVSYLNRVQFEHTGPIKVDLHCNPFSSAFVRFVHFCFSMKKYALFLSAFSLFHICTK